MPSNSALSASQPPALEVHLLGLVDFDAALWVQEHHRRQLAGASGAAPGVLLLCEHPPLVTVGAEGGPDDLACDPAELAARGLSLRWVHRGGGTLIHLPGQLCGYLVTPLEPRCRGLADLSSRLESALMATLAGLRVPGVRRSEAGAGVCGRLGRVASIGMSIRDGITSHGFFLNASADMTWLRLIRPAPERPSTLSAELQSPVPLGAVRSRLIECLAAALDFPRHHVYTSHPLLHRARRRVPVPIPDALPGRRP